MGIFGWNYLTSGDKRTIAAGVREGRAHGGPYHMEIHPADRCNIDCFFCSTAAIRGTDELPRPRFESLLDEAVAHGLRSIRLAGGGEPLFHREIVPILEHVERLGIRIENITTNGVLLLPKTVDILVRVCDELTISLNTHDAPSYARMMKTTEKNFHRVLDNVRALAAKRGKQRTPRIVVQFLVWKENYRHVEEMYRLARSLGADHILFNGLSGLTPEQMLTMEERRELLDRYREVLREDEFRHIRNISSYEYDISADIAALVHDLSAARRAQPLARRAVNFLRRPDALRAKLAHFVRMQLRYRRERHVADYDDACIIGWYSMLVRSTGDVGPCCILQGKRLGNIMEKSVTDIWYGQAYQTFRTELNRIRAARHAWTPEGTETITEGGCGLAGPCPMRSYYYRSDDAFARELART
ncbi:MAG TPA: radical SAM protein [Thermoanaerobaculia bacterium]